jgi:hypothetical protein
LARNLMHGLIETLKAEQSTQVVQKAHLEGVYKN